MLDKIEKHLETMKIEDFSLSDLKLYTDIVIQIDQYKATSKFMEKIKDIDGIAKTNLI